MLHTCPVLSFTPDVEEALALFRHTHEVTTSGFGAVWFRRSALPAEGGVEDQPAKVMQQLEWLERLHNDELAEELKDKRNRERNEVDD